MVVVVVEEARARRRPGTKYDCCMAGESQAGRTYMICPTSSGANGRVGKWHCNIFQRL